MEGAASDLGLDFKPVTPARIVEATAFDPSAVGGDMCADRTFGGPVDVAQGDVVESRFGEARTG